MYNLLEFYFTLDTVGHLTFPACKHTACLSQLQCLWACWVKQTWQVAEQQSSSSSPSILRLLAPPEGSTAANKGSREWLWRLDRLCQSICVKEQFEPLRMTECILLSSVAALCCSNRTKQWKGATVERIHTNFSCYIHEIYQQNSHMVGW